MSGKYIKTVKKLSSVLFVSFIAAGCGNDRGDSLDNAISGLGVDENLTQEFEFGEEDINASEPTDIKNAYDLPVIKTGQIESFKKYDDGYYKKGKDRDFVRDNDTEIVKDIATGLEWMDNNETISAKNFDEANNYCTSLALDGNDWRVPNIKELQSIAYDGNMMKNIDSIFENTALGESKYWSSTKYSNPDYQDSLVWQMHYRDGTVRTVYKSNNTTDMYIRCVRNI